MQCLYCESTKTKVTNSVKSGKRVLRERTCQSCQKVFYTEETRDITAQTALKEQLHRRREINRRRERLC